MGRSVEIARAFITLEAETKGLDNQLSQAEKSLGRTASFVLAHPVAAFTALGTAAIAAGLKLADMAAEVDHAFELITASIPDATNRLKDLRSEASMLSMGFGISQKEIADGMVALARTGISSVDDLIIANRAAVAASRATGTDFATTISLLDSALDAFGLNAKDSEAILAKLFVTSQGKTSFQELAPIFEAVGKAAVKGGVDWATLTEAAVTLKTEGIKTKQIITALAKGLDEEGAPAVRALAAASHVASDGVQEMRAQTALMNESVLVSQARIKEQLNAALLDLGRSILPLVTKAMNGLVLILDSLTGKIDAIKSDAATASMISLAGAVGHLTNEASKTAAIEQLKDAIQRSTGAAVNFATGFVDLGDKVKDFSDAKLKGLHQGLLATIESGTLSGNVLKQIGVATAIVNAEIVKRGTRPLVPPVDPKVAEGLRGVTAGLLATGTAGDSAAKQIAASRKTLFELEKEWTGATITLATAQAQAIEAIEVVFGDKIAGLKGKDRDRALAILAETKARSVAAWQSIADVIGDAVEPRMKTTETTVAKLSAAHTDLNVQVANSTIRYGALSVAEQEAIEKQQAHREALQQTTQEVSGMVDVFGALATAIGLSDPELDKVVHGIADIADAIGQVASGNIAGGLIQGISGLSGVISGLFGGESESARKVRQELERTRDALERHRQTLGDLIAISQPGAQVVNLTGGIHEILAAFKAMQERGGVAKVLTAIDSGHIKPILAKRGLTIDDLEELAKQAGVDLHLGQRADFFSIEQLNNLLKDIDARDSGFAETFQGQLDKLTQRWTIIGADAGKKLGDLVALAGDPQLGSSALAGLKDFNLNLEAGRAGATEFLSKLLDRGDLTNAELGGLNLQKFRDLLGEIAGLIRDVGSSGSPVRIFGPGLNPDRPPIAGLQGGANAWPVDPIADPIFTPDLEATNWEELLGLQVEERDLLAGILGKLDFSPIQPPPLPAGVLGGAGAPAGAAGVDNSITIAAGAIQITIQSTGNSQQDGQEIGRYLVDEILNARFGNARQVRGDTAVDLR